MKFAHADLDDYWDVDLEWTRQRLVVDDCASNLPPNASDDYGVYRFERHHHLHKDKKPQIVRIGVAFEQTLKTRLLQYSQKTLRSYRGKGRLTVSVASFAFDGQHRRARYEAIEHLLIWFMKPNGNIKKIASLPEGWYQVNNLGCRGRLPARIIYPAVGYSRKP